MPQLRKVFRQDGRHDRSHVIDISLSVAISTSWILFVGVWERPLLSKVVYSCIRRQAGWRCKLLRLDGFSYRALYTTFPFSFNATRNIREAFSALFFLPTASLGTVFVELEKYHNHT